jgi:hypothetical protein
MWAAVDASTSGIGFLRSVVLRFVSRLDESRLDEQQAPGAGLDDDRTVDVTDHDFVVLPEQSGDDTDRGWGEYAGSNDDRLLAERPPHWG